MKLIACALPVLLSGLCSPAAATEAGWVQMSEQRRNDLRDAVEAHRASQREEVRREETSAGRRLTAAELAELRAQVRQQWAPRGETLISVQSSGNARASALPSPSPSLSPSLAPTPARGTLPAPRLQRP